MRLILSDITDVYQNLALEDFLLHQTGDNILMLWQSHGAVVCGKHQNLCAEANYAFCRRHNIAMARRLSGGGTVYHDEGNVNFTFIHNLEEGIDKAIDFRRFLDPVIAALAALGVKAEYSGRNDLLVDGRKVSGNAEHIYQQKKRVLHHGTLLFDSRLGDLRDALHSTGNYLDKAVKSVRSEVCNLKDHLPHIPDTSSFIERLCSEFEQIFGFSFSSLSEAERAQAALLAAEKYANESWITGYSPRYVMNRTLQTDEGTFELKMKVEKGLITELSFASDSFADNTFNTDIFIGLPLNEKTEQTFYRVMGLNPADPALQYSFF